MKSWLKAFLILSLSLVITGCNGGDTRLKQSQLLALEWAEAEIQWDGDQRMKLLTPKAKEKYKNSQHTHGEATSPDKRITDYEMIEWKLDDNSYVYRLVYPDEDSYDTTWTQTRRTEEGWGITDIILPYPKAQKLIENIEPTIIKEME